MIYSFEEFSIDVNMGREIEFFYNKTMYFITHNKDECILLNTLDKSSQHFINPEYMLKNAKIASKYLWELWDDIKIEYIY
ncbi:hypothetical protein KPL47_00840 [Clostridium estertheticum]|uniref:hypothetical protein n=1 Tax=Clostridium estertheticum TaxID=238834 RepID=UPI001C0A96D4|nr:hypothetical protein [Clostridium estertheticum]MBU3174908.1 hypothetical protein [Clostridium estertheticum]MCB2362438.1 hypothetical protein [Clostridium estertheticum]